MSNKEPKDFFEQIQEVAQESVPHILERMRLIAEGGGTRLIHHKCTACGQMNDVETDKIDAEETRKVLESFSSILLRAQAAKKDENVSGVVRERLRAIRDMTDEEIAEELLALEHEARSA